MDNGNAIESTVFESFVNASNHKPFVQMTCSLGDEPVFATTMSPDLATALGLRAIQAAIEAERDAGLIEFIYKDFSKEMGFDNRQQIDGFISMMLLGLRKYRQQFDADAGSMRPLSDKDNSELSDG